MAAFYTLDLSQIQVSPVLARRFLSETVQLNVVILVATVEQATNIAMAVLGNITGLNTALMAQGLPPVQYVALSISIDVAPNAQPTTAQAPPDVNVRPQPQESKGGALRARAQWPGSLALALMYIGAALRPRA